MLLAINANNTNTVFALWNAGQLLGSWRISTDAKRTADEYVVWLDHVLGLGDHARHEVSATIVASVVPEANFNLIKLCDDYCASTPLVVGEPGVELGWSKWVGDHGASISIEHFGASAPGTTVLEQFGYNLDNVVTRASALLERVS